MTDGWFKRQTEQVKVDIENKPGWIRRDNAESKTSETKHSDSSKASKPQSKD